MKKTFKKIGKFILLTLGLMALLIGMLLAVVLINSGEKPEPIVDKNGEFLPNSIAIIKDTIINGAMQRLTIRGQDINNPILLRVHGGPGQPHAPQAFRSVGIDLEDLFTVCYWDQRGAGPAYFKEKTPDSLINKDAIIQDGLSVTQYLREKLKKDKVYIEGASWGTIISALMVKAKPEYFKAYIGIGQISDNPKSEILSYNYAMVQSIKNKDTLAINDLKRIGSPPYSSIEKGNEAVQVQRKIVSRYMPKNIDYSMVSILKLIFLYEGWSFGYKFDYFKSGGYGPAAPLLWPEAVKTNLFEEMPEWPIPVYILQGDSDHFTETSLATKYFDSIKSPYKKMKLFENTGHVVFYERPQEYREFYLNEVLNINLVTVLLP